MQSFNAAFEIIEDNNCPLYRVGESFCLTERSFSAPGNKDVCLILVREMTELLFVLMGQEGAQEKEGSPDSYSCSGCNGLIKFRPSEEVAAEAAPPDPEKQALLKQVTSCPFFHAIPSDQLAGISDFFRRVNISEGQTLIRKGEPNFDLFVVISGELSVDDGPVHIANLGPGEICGEMSYFSGHTAGATVTASTAAELIGIGGESFGRIIDQAPSVQLFMAQLLARRLSQSNDARSHDFDSAMQGRLKEMAPAELFQSLHMHQKTGVLALVFSGRTARVSFRDGSIINANCGSLENQEAIYAILAQKNGTYTFRAGLDPAHMKAAEIGDFTSLLMEGIKRIDENSGADPK